MFYIQFCVCFYAILYVCHCHFTGNVYEKCTQTNKIKLEANLDKKNRHEAIISQNTHTTIQYLAKNTSKIYVDIDKRLKKVIPKKKKRIETNKSIDNIDKGIIKKNYSIFGIDLTLYKLGNKKQLITKKIINSDDYLENSIDNRKQTELVEVTGDFAIPKKDTVEGQSTVIKNENITEKVTEIFQNNVTDKNIKNNDMTKIIQKYDSPKNVKQRCELTKDTGEFTISKNNIVEEKSTNKNESITENVASIFQINGMNKIVLNDDLPKKVNQRREFIEDTGEFTIPKNDIVEEKSTNKNKSITENVAIIFQINDMDKIVLNDDLPKNVKQRSELIEDTGVTIPKNYTVEEKSTNKNKSITENVASIFQINDMDKIVLNDDLPKNVKQRREFIEDTGEFTIPKNYIVEEKSSVIKNKNNNKHVTKIFQINDMDKPVLKDDLPKNVKQRSELIEDTGVTIPKNYTVEEKSTIIKNENIIQNVTKLLENNIMNNNVRNFDLPKNIKQRSDLDEDTGEFTIPKNDIVEEKSTNKNKSITENVAIIFQINDMDKIVLNDDLPKNVKQRSELIEDTGVTIPKNYTVEEKSTNKNKSITENVASIFQINDMDKIVLNDDLPKNVKQRREFIEDTEEFTIPKNYIVEEKSSVIKNKNNTKHVTKIFQINDMDKPVLKDDLPKNVKQRSESIEDTGVTIPKNYTVEEKSTIIKNENIIQNVTKLLENNIMNNNVRNFDLPKNIKQRSDLDEDTGEFTIPINEIVEKKSTIINHTNIIENVTKIFQNNAMNKNLQKRDIGIPKNVVHNYNPEIFQNHDANNYQKIDFRKKIENYDTPKNINHDFNSDKLYNYQNDETNYKNIIYKKSMLKKDKLTRRYDDNASQNVRPQFQTRLNNDLIKKSLDEFKMIRRKTHYTMPDVEFKPDIDKHEIDYYQDVAYPKFQEYDSEATSNGVRNHVKPDHHVEDNRNNMYPTYGEINHIYNSYEDPNEFKNFKKLNNLIARQKQIIEKLTQLQRDGRKKPTKHDFDTLMSEVEAKQKIYRKWPNYTDFAFETTTAKTTTKLTTTEKPTTILTLFDETEVRHALKNDPHVKRILKMANLKREKYLNNVRRYLTRNNYTHDSKYAMNLAESANGHRAETEETTSFVDLEIDKSPNNNR